jgi:hypothetical protein
MIRLHDGSIIINSAIRTRDKVGHPLHLFDPAGRAVMSFGSSDESFRSDASFLLVRRLTLSTQGRFWSARVNEYALELFDANGRRHVSLRREPPWFSAWFEPTPITPLTPSKPNIVAVHEDRQGQLWVMVEVPDDKQGTLLRPASVGEERSFTLPETEQAYDTVVEVLDPRLGRLILAERLPGLFVRFMGDGTMVSVTETSDGTPVLDVWRPQIVSR